MKENIVSDVYQDWLKSLQIRINIWEQVVSLFRDCKALASVLPD